MLFCASSNVVKNGLRGENKCINARIVADSSLAGNDATNPK